MDNKQIIESIADLVIRSGWSAEDLAINIGEILDLIDKKVEGSD